MVVSIIIVNFNTKALTLQCIGSILKSRTKSKYEIVVVDNASDDGSQKALKKFGNSIQLIENKKNLGFAKANNQGIKASLGKYKLLLNSDTKVKKGAIDILVHFAEKNNDAGAIVPRLINPDGSIQASIFPFPTVAKNIRQWWLCEKGLLDKYYPETKKPVRVDVAVMSAFLITPRAIKEVGLLSEEYFMYYEDFDYCRRIYKSGLSIYYVAKAEVVHYHGASGSMLVREDKQWYRLLEGSRRYHGFIKYLLIYFIERSSDVFRRRVLGK